jgi:hypothetical protein
MRPRRGFIYGLAYLCVRYPFLSAMVIAMAAAVGAAQVLPIANGLAREMVASAIGIISYLSWSGLNDSRDDTANSREAAKFLDA